MENRQEKQPGLRYTNPEDNEYQRPDQKSWATDGPLKEPLKILRRFNWNFLTDEGEGRLSQVSQDRTNSLWYILGHLYDCAKCTMGFLGERPKMGKGWDEGTLRMNKHRKTERQRDNKGQPCENKLLVSTLA